MISRHDISDELLNAFVDNELDTEEQNKVFLALEQDEVLRTHACQLQGMKKLLHHAYPLPAEKAAKPARRPRTWPATYSQCLAAGVMLLLFGGSSGWVISNAAWRNDNPKMNRLVKIIQSDNLALTSDKIIVQVSSANPVRLKAALDETENLLKNYHQNHQPLQMEILANGGGLNLLRTGVSPFEQRVAKMKTTYPNLQFVACEETISSLQHQGVPVHLLPNTLLASTALNEIDKRVHQGWDFVRA